MSASVDRWVDPYAGLAASIITSNVVDLRDALSWTFSWYTTAGTTSVHTFQVSNASVELGQTSPANASYVNYTAFGTATGGGSVEGAAGYRYGRVLRVASGASVVIDLNKQVG